MSEQRRLPALPLILLFGALLAAGAAAVTLGKPDSAPGRVATAPSGGAAGLSLLDTPAPLPDLRFEDGDGNPVGLSDFRGRIVLLNVWATWCPPCRKEMPTLDRLQAALGGPDFEVVALSIDKGGVEQVKGFYSATGIRDLRIYLDRDSAAMADPGILGVPISTSKGSLGIVGIPTTLLIDRDGQELGRLIGPAEWDSPEMLALIRRQIGSGQPADLAPPDFNATPTIERPRT